MPNIFFTEMINDIVKIVKHVAIYIRADYLAIFDSHDNITIRETYQDTITVKGVT